MYWARPLPSWWKSSGGLRRMQESIGRVSPPLSRLSPPPRRWLLLPPKPLLRSLKTTTTVEEVKQTAQLATAESEVRIGERAEAAQVSESGKNRLRTQSTQ